MKKILTYALIGGAIYYFYNKYKENEKGKKPVMKYKN